MNLSQVKYLTFDCYGTLIDWETGILQALQPLLMRYQCELSDAQLLADYGKFESEAEKGPFQSYRRVLRQVVQSFGAAYGFAPTEAECELLPDSVATWQPFPDTGSALKDLAKHFQLVVLSNVDRDMIAGSVGLLGNPFSHVFPAENIGSYKPELDNFRFMQKKLGAGPGEILHAAQSLYHDIAPAVELGWKHVWVHRGKGRGGATPAAAVQPIEKVDNLEELVRWVRKWR